MWAGKCMIQLVLLLLFLRHNRYILPLSSFYYIPAGQATADTPRLPRKTPKKPHDETRILGMRNSFKLTYRIILRLLLFAIELCCNLFTQVNSNEKSSFFFFYGTEFKKKIFYGLKPLNM